MKPEGGIHQRRDSVSMIRGFARRLSGVRVLLTLVMLVVYSLGLAPDAPGASRFVQESEGVVADTETNLTWLRNADIFNGRLPWHVANEYIKQMNAGKRQNFGFKDWRIPTLDEIASLIDRSTTYPSLPVENPFVNVRSDFYWTSTGGMNIVPYAWSADLGTGGVRLDYVSYCNFLYTWPVRGVANDKVRNSARGKTRTLPAATAFNPQENFCAQEASVPPSVPSWLTATAISPSEIMLSWLPPGEQSRVVWHNIYEGNKVVKSIPESYFIVSGLERATRHCYRVSAYDSEGLESERSVAACAGTWSIPARGTVWGMGINNHGQLGDGTLVDRHAQVLALGISDAVSLSAGVEHSVAVLADGTVWAWGSNQRGQLGDGTTQTRMEPVQLSGVTDAVQASAGWYHTTLLMSDGTVRSWGRNYYGQLGYGKQSDSLKPVTVIRLKDVKKVVSGLYHTLALKNDGTVWSWGWNRKGQLGIEIGPIPKRHAPIQIPGLAGVKDIAAGGYHSVALMSDGTVKAWGSNDFGQLGIGGNVPEYSFPVQVRGLSGVKDIDAGQYFTVVVLTDGTVWAWGKNDFGQLGSATLAAGNKPVQVRGLKGVASVTAGANHATALLEGGTVMVWGKRGRDKESRPVPEPLSALKSMANLSAGMDYTLAIKEN
jgi:alpha-tubulin suppressor-like RCC1 family protein